MAVVKTLTVCGLKVEVWEQSFRVEGMHSTVWVGEHMTDDRIVEMVTTIYEAIEKKAINSGRATVAEAAKAMVDKLLGKAL